MNNEERRERRGAPRRPRGEMRTESGALAPGRQALVNLVSNALDALQLAAAAAGPGYVPRVEVTTSRDAAGVTIRVTDNGTGIPEAVRAHILEPFFTTKPTGRGNIGLGLSLSRDLIVRGYAGSIDVETTEGGGTTFTVTLPDPAG